MRSFKVEEVRGMSKDDPASAYREVNLVSLARCEVVLKLDSSLPPLTEEQQTRIALQLQAKLDELLLAAFYGGTNA